MEHVVCGFVPAFGFTLKKAVVSLNLAGMALLLGYSDLTCFTSFNLY